MVLLLSKLWRNGNLMCWPLRMQQNVITSIVTQKGKVASEICPRNVYLHSDVIVQC